LGERQRQPAVPRPQQRDQEHQAQQIGELAVGEGVPFRRRLDLDSSDEVHHAALTLHFAGQPVGERVGVFILPFPGELGQKTRANEDHLISEEAVFHHRGIEGFGIAH